MLPWVLLTMGCGQPPPTPTPADPADAAASEARAVGAWSGPVVADALARSLEPAVGLAGAVGEPPLLRADQLGPGREPDQGVLVTDTTGRPGWFGTSLESGWVDVRTLQGHRAPRVRWLRESDLPRLVQLDRLADDEILAELPARLEVQPEPVEGTLTVYAGKPATLRLDGMPDGSVSPVRPYPALASVSVVLPGPKGDVHARGMPVGDAISLLPTSTAPHVDAVQAQLMGHAPIAMLPIEVDGHTWTLRFEHDQRLPLLLRSGQLMPSQGTEGTLGLRFPDGLTLRFTSDLPLEEQQWRLNQGGVLNWLAAAAPTRVRVEREDGSSEATVGPLKIGRGPRDKDPARWPDPVALGSFAEAASTSVAVDLPTSLQSLQWGNGATSLQRADGTGELSLPAGLRSLPGSSAPAAVPGIVLQDVDHQIGWIAASRAHDKRGWWLSTRPAYPTPPVSLVTEAQLLQRDWSWTVAGSLRLVDEALPVSIHIDETGAAEVQSALRGRTSVSVHGDLVRLRIVGDAGTVEFSGPIREAAPEGFWQVDLLPSPDGFSDRDDVQAWLDRACGPDPVARFAVDDGNTVFEVGPVRRQLTEAGQTQQVVRVHAHPGEQGRDVSHLLEDGRWLTVELPPAWGLLADWDVPKKSAWSHARAEGLIDPAARWWRLASERTLSCRMVPADPGTASHPLPGQGDACLLRPLSFEPRSCD